MNFAHEPGGVGANQAALAQALSWGCSQVVGEARVISKLLHSHVWLDG